MTRRESQPPPPPLPPSGGTRPTPREAAIAGILGLAPNADAAALLGVDASNTDDGEIVDALNARLAMVNAHRYGGTPLGDEARLALHAAAAQLLGGRRRPYDVASQDDDEAELPARWTRPTALPPAQLALQQDAVLALGAHGGWNSTTMRHLTMLAHARGLSADDLAVALTRLARRSGPAISSQQSESNGVVAAPGPGGELPSIPSHTADRSGGDMALLGAMAVAVILTLVAAAAVLIAIPVMRTSGQNAQQIAQQEDGESAIAATAEPQPSDGQPKGNAGASQEAEGATQPRAATPDTRIDTIVTDLRLAADRQRKGEATAQAVFERAVLTLADNWPRVRPDRRLAALGLIIDHMYLVREDSTASRQLVGFLTGPIAETGGEPGMAARAWQVGAIVRLSQEQDLPGPIAESLRVFLLQEAPIEARASSDFIGGVAVALRAELAALSEAENFDADPESWTPWLVCAQGLEESEPVLARRLMLAALEAVLLRGPEPTDERIFQIVRRLVVALPWRAEDESRPRVLAWFDDPGVTIADLHAVTNVLATASSAAGVDATMVLPVLASQSQRAQVRDRFAAAWNVQSAMAHGAVANRWLSEARRHLGAELSNTQVDQAVDAAVSARLIAAGDLLWQGLANDADVVLLQLRDGLDAGQRRAATGTESIYRASHSQPSDWALRYNQQRRPELKLDLLEALSRSGPTHAAEAELVAQAFVRGSTVGIRERAGNILVSHANKPVVVAAVLETLPLPGAEPRRRQMVENVTAVRLPSGDSWELVARRALVERLLELLAAEGELARIDRAAQAIGDAYVSAASGAAAPSDRTPAELAAEAAWVRARQRADRLVPPAVWPWSPGEVDRRLAGRTRLASGRVQFFAAYQSALTEIELYNAAGERPAVALRLSDELDAMQQARREARGVLEQIAITERTRLRIWVWRLSEATAGGPQ